MANKRLIVNAICELFSSSSLGFSSLSKLILKKEWTLPGDRDFPNYQFVFALCQEYCAFAASIEKPVAEGIVYENVVRYIASLAKQDPAYYTRFNGIMYRVICDFNRGKISSQPGANHEYFVSLVKWWDTFDCRERNHGVYKRLMDHISQKYLDEPFYQQSIDWVLNWVGQHQEQFVFSDDMNPKRWYGSNGVGFVDNLAMGGMG